LIYFIYIKILFLFYKINIIIIFRILFKKFYKKKINNLNNQNILIYKKYNYFNIYKLKIINKFKNKFNNYNLI